MSNRFVMVVAGFCLVAVLSPMVVEAIPSCGPTHMSDTEGGSARCAGLWAAVCCDFAAPRVREDTVGPPLLASAPPHARGLLPAAAPIRPSDQAVAVRVLDWWLVPDTGPPVSSTVLLL